MRRAAKRDETESEIVATLQKCGATVFRLNVPVDLLIGYRNRTILAECKTGRRTLNANQRAFIESWNGGDIPVLRNADDALALINGWEKRWQRTS